MTTSFLPTILVVFAAGQPQLEWKSFAPDGQGFVIILPNRPKNHSKVVPSPVEWIKISHYICDSERKGQYYSVITQTYDNLLTAEQQAELLTGFKTKIAKKVGGELVRASDVTVAGGSAVELLVRYPKDALQEYARGRVVITSKRVHQYQAFGDEAFVTGADVNRFLDSFKVTQ